MESLEQPKIDIKEIQERANVAAKKAYLSEVDNYYTSYDSPYKKMIKKELEKQEFKYNMELPNILNEINKKLSAEVDIIANNAIANTYLPLVQTTLIGLPKQIKLSEIFKLLIEELDPESDTYDEFHFSYSKSNHGWLDCELSTPESNYELTLHEADDNKYQLLSFPNNKYKTGYSSNMKIYKDDVKIEMPFTPNILQDKVLTIMFKLMLNNSHIEKDVNNFEEDMFPEDEGCHY